LNVTDPDEQLTGGSGSDRLSGFFRDNFIFQNSVDVELELNTRLIGIDHVVDELIDSFTHDRAVD
jgi:carboxymethylenebutenolidase